MKRVAVIAIFMVVMASLFTFSVFAATPDVPDTAYDSDTVSGVSILTNVYKFYNNAWGTTALPGGSYIPYYVTMQIFNNNDQAALVNSVGFNIDLGQGPRGLYNIINYSEDLMITWTSGIFSVSPSNDYSYGNGIVVPPKESLYLVAEVQISVNWDSANQSWPTTYLNGVTNNVFNVGVGDYPYGSNATDLSSVITYLNSIDQTLDDFDTNTDQLEGLLNDIKTQLTFTGSYSSFANTNYVYKNFSFNENVDKFSASASITLFKSYMLSDELEIALPSSVYHEGTRVTPIVIRITANNTNAYAVRSETVLTITDALPRNSTTSYYIDHVDSDIFYGAYFGGANSGSYINISIGYQNTSSNKGYIPSGYHSAVIYAYAIDTPSVTIALNENMYSSNTFELTTTELPKSESWALYDIKQYLIGLYESLVKPSADDNTEEAQDMNDDIHEAEQVWYDNNSEALEEVGLSNYRFNPSQSNGINQAVTQFQAVWNALGDWTNVYIFILILSISTYIIRHEPTTRVKQYRSSVQAERAERISYYGRKNAESRAAASSSGSTMKNAIRRRK